MSFEVSFHGFDRAAVRFLEELAASNTREWFEANRARCEEQLLAPARAFTDALGLRLLELAPGLHVDARLGQSIRPLERDPVPAGGPPYAPRLAIFLWAGHAAPDECSGFFFDLEPPRLRVGAGLARFPSAVLQAYREQILDDAQGRARVRLLEQLRDRPGFALGGRRLEQLPPGVDADHPHAEWLLFDGLTVYTEEGFPRALYSEKLLDYCQERYRDMVPLHSWLRDLTSRIF